MHRDRRMRLGKESSETPVNRISLFISNLFQPTNSTSLVTMAYGMRQGTGSALMCFL